MPMVPSVRTTEADVAMGIQNEILCHHMIEDITGESMLKLPNTFAVIDFEGPSSWAELKSRRCASDTYDTTIIGVGKGWEAVKHMKRGKRVFFVFKFTDGLFYIRFIPKLFDTYTLGEITTFRDNKLDPRGSHLHIPVSHLTRWPCDRSKN